ncbi:MAG TPA: cation:proton antiporter [Candidatus Hydrogenedentes bacterium]|nr:cation:proton antiporter [Candidatus Hydrogenedentota bacterium]
MIFNLAELLLAALIADWLFRKCKMPGLVGMLLTGVLFGPNLLGMISPALFDVGVELRPMALVVILLRAGLKLDRQTLNRVGGRALALACIPAFLEGVVVALLAPRLLGLSPMAAVVLGAVLCAVSPAVVVPMMLNCIDQKRGSRTGAPTMVLAAASLENTLVIVIISALTAMFAGAPENPIRALAVIPVSVLIGIAIGCLTGLALCRIFERFNPRATRRAIALIGISLVLMHGEQLVKAWFPFVSLPAVMAIGFIMLERYEPYAHEMALKLSKIWIFAEILLFTMIGAQMELNAALPILMTALLLMSAGLVARCLGALLCLSRSSLSPGERLFVCATCLPKGTVQAAVGAMPLTALAAAGMDTGPGEVILTMAVLSIAVTAPLGAWAISYASEHFLEKQEPDSDYLSSSEMPAGS